MLQMKQIVASLLIFVLTTAQKSHSNNQKLNILVLYESLCPDSERFMERHLGPSYDEFKDSIDITLVPFGKSYSENNGENFYCQHGPAECKGNRMQSCVLNQTTDQALQVEFVVCQMTTRDKGTVSPCAESVGLSSDIDDCMNTRLGTELQLQAEKITQRYDPDFVPTIVYENVFNQALQDSSIRNFRGTVCRLLNEAGIIGFDTQQKACAHFF